MKIITNEKKQSVTFEFSAIEASIPLSHRTFIVQYKLNKIKLHKIEHCDLIYVTPTDFLHKINKNIFFQYPLISF